MPQVDRHADESPAEGASAVKLPQYPYYNYRKSLEVATAVKNAGGNRAPVSKNILAHELEIGETTPMFAQVVASAKTFGMIEGRGAYGLTETATRYFFPQSEPERRLAELEFFGNPAAFKSLISRFDEAILPSAQSIANILLSQKRVPESWKDRAATIFVSTADLLGVLDPTRCLRYGAAVEQARSPEGGHREQPPPVMTVGAGGVGSSLIEQLKTVRGEAAHGQIIVRDESGVAPANLNRWVFTEAGATVQVSTPNPLPRALWERLTRYVAMLEPTEEAPKGGGS